MAACRSLLRTLQEWMGHTDTETTTVYAHYFPAANEVAGVDAAFGRADADAGANSVVPGLQATVALASIHWEWGRELTAAKRAARLRPRSQFQSASRASPARSGAPRSLVETAYPGNVSCFNVLTAAVFSPPGRNPIASPPSCALLSARCADEGAHPCGLYGRGANHRGPLVASRRGGERRTRRPTRAPRAARATAGAAVHPNSENGRKKHRGIRRGAHGRDVSRRATRLDPWRQQPHSFCLPTIC